MSIQKITRTIRSYLPRYGLSLATAWFVWSYIGLSLTKPLFTAVPDYTAAQSLLAAICFVLLLGTALFMLDLHLTVFGHSILPLALPATFGLYGAAVCYESQSIWAGLAFAVIALAVLTLSFNELESRKRNAPLWEPRDMKKGEAPLGHRYRG